MQGSVYEFLSSRCASSGSPIVIDEWGSFEGIVTMEDIVEEIVGEVRLGGHLLRVEEVDGARIARVVAQKDPA